MIFNYLLWFIFIWFTSFFLHEYMHILEHLRQGGYSYRIEIWHWHGLPSMRVFLSGIQRKPCLVYLAGGLYTGMLLFVILFIYVLTCGFHMTGFTYSIICIGVLQCCYGFFEMVNREIIGSDSYMREHYLLYLWVVVFVSLLWLWRLGII